MLYYKLYVKIIIIQLYNFLIHLKERFNIQRYIIIYMLKLLFLTL